MHTFRNNSKPTTPKDKPTTPLIEKGEFGGVCNRTACDKEEANYFNHSTLKHYCKSCAMTINMYNRVGALELFGHDLCLLIKPEQKENNG